MGVETTLIAAGALLGGGAAVMGAKEARKGRKQAEAFGRQQIAEQQKQSAQLQSEQQKLSLEQENVRKKLNAGIARGNKRRIRGGLFGEGELSPGGISSTLG